MITVNFGDTAGTDVLLKEFPGAGDGETEILQAPLIGPTGGIANDERKNIEAEVIMRCPPHGAADQKSPVAAPQVQDDGRLSAEKFLPIQIPFGQLLESGLRPLFRPQDFAGNGNAELPLDLSPFFHGLR